MLKRIFLIILIALCVMLPAGAEYSYAQLGQNYSIEYKLVLFRPVTRIYFASDASGNTEITDGNPPELSNTDAYQSPYFIAFETNERTKSFDLKITLLELGIHDENGKLLSNTVVPYDFRIFEVVDQQLGDEKYSVSSVTTGNTPDGTFDSVLQSEFETTDPIRVVYRAEYKVGGASSLSVGTYSTTVTIGVDRV